MLVYDIEELELCKVLIVKHEFLMRAGPKVMEYSEQDNTQLVSPPTNLTVCLFVWIFSYSVNCQLLISN